MSKLGDETANLAIDHVLRLEKELAETRARLEELRHELLLAKPLRLMYDAERAVLDAATKWRLSWEDHESVPSAEELPEEYALYLAVGEMMAEPMVRDYEAELARQEAQK